jgi:hypothetical protein
LDALKFVNDPCLNAHPGDRFSLDTRNALSFAISIRDLISIAETLPTSISHNSSLASETRASYLIFPIKDSHEKINFILLPSKKTQTVGFLTKMRASSISQ